MNTIYESNNFSSVVITQVLAHFGPYFKKREEMLHKIRLNTDLLADNTVDTYLATNGTANGDSAIPKIKDVVGEALPRIGTYKHLDNTKQVVALIDDVSKTYCLYAFHRMHCIIPYDFNWS